MKQRHGTHRATFKGRVVSTLVMFMASAWRGSDLREERLRESGERTEKRGERMEVDRGVGT